MSSTPVLLDGTDNVYISDNVTQEQARQWADEHSRMLDPVRRAKYKIEVLFGVKHSVVGNPYGSISLWECGAYLNGDGDALIWRCPGKSSGRSSCDAVIPAAYNKNGRAVCPACGVVWASDCLVDTTFYRMPMGRWADTVVKWLYDVGLDADVVVRYHYDDIREAASKEQEKELRGELLEAARSHNRRKPRLYRINDIINDTSTGADLRGRLLAFLRD